MKTRRFVRAGISATEIALGAWAIGGVSYGSVSKEDAQATVRSYLDAGGNFIDTARIYRDSEERVGETLAGFVRREDVILASKTPNGEYSESVPKIREDLEQSLRMLKTDYIDIYQLHMPPEKSEDIEAAMNCLRSLKQEGKIRAIGASIKAANVTQATVDLCRVYIDAGVDAIQLIYSVARQRASHIFRYAREQGVGIIARTVLESGFLSGKYDGTSSFGEGDHRQRWSPEQLDGFAEIARDLDERKPVGGYMGPSDVAIQFALAEDAVSTLILGARSPQQVERNVRAGTLEALPDDLLAYLKSKYEADTDRFNL